MGSSNFPFQVSPTVEFRDDTTVQVFTTCSVGEGTYSVGEGALFLSEMTYAEEVCDPSGSVATHDFITGVFSAGRRNFEIDATRLIIMNGPIGVGATTE